MSRTALLATRQLAYNTEQAAKMIGRSPRTLQDWRLSRKNRPPKGPVVHVDEDGRPYYLHDDLVDWLDGMNKVGGAA